jgi:hypothetical protein
MEVKMLDPSETGFTDEVRKKGPPAFDLGVNFRHMDIYESVVVPSGAGGSINTMALVRSRLRKMNDRLFSVRKIAGGVLVTRKA